MTAASLLHPLVAIAAAPFLQAVVLRTKSVFAGRRGPDLLQPYRDLARLARKGAIHSTSTCWAARAAAPIALGATAAALLLVPAGAVPAVAAFSGDFVLVASLLALARFATILGALDAGSSFQGMGASREALVAALAEPGFMLAMAVTCVAGGAGSLSALAAAPPGVWAESGHAVVLALVALGGLFLAENARIPVDDPATHLELTMIHEVMILDASGPDLAMFELASAIRMWVLGAILVGVASPLRPGTAAGAWLVAAAGMAAVAVFVGVVESTIGRLRLARVPQLLIGATALGVLALLLME